MKSWVFLLFLSGCTLFFGKEAPKSAKDVHYSLSSFTRPYWEYKNDKRSDFVFQNQDGRVLLSNSFCNEFQDQPLDQLATKTFRSVTHFKKLSGEYTTFHNREAYRMEGTGTVDGVPVSLQLLNTRRDNCYFDFLFIVPEGTKKDSSFDVFLKAVVFR